MGKDTPLVRKKHTEQAPNKKSSAPPEPKKPHPLDSLNRKDPKKQKVTKDNTGTC